MGRYLDRLHEEFEQITEGINTVVDRAADEDRDVTDSEETQINRDRERASELEKAIATYSEIEQRNGRVSTLRGSVAASPQTRQAGPASDDAYDVAREFPSIGDYAITVHRAMMHKDPEAIEKLERATAHQLLADNPGIVPKPVLGPVINLLASSRPFISAITNRPLPAGKFDRPVITQHVAVGVQAAEKTLTESQKMIIGSLAVTAATYAGHLNISRQDVKWSNPSILSIVYEDFARMYALATCEAASAAFVASVVAAPTAIDEATGGAVTAALYEGTAAALTASDQLPDTMFVAPDVWAALGGMTNVSGAQSFPSLSLTAQNGNPLGLKLVVEQHFPAGTFIVGPAALAEWYEDVDGLMQVGEPDVLGQLVGYAGFGAFLNTAPDAFARYTLPVPVP